MRYSPHTGQYLLLIKIKHKGNTFFNIFIRRKDNKWGSRLVEHKQYPIINYKTTDNKHFGGAKASEEKFQSDITTDIKLSESEFILNFAQKFNKYPLKVFIYLFDLSIILF